MVVFHSRFFPSATFHVVATGPPSDTPAEGQPDDEVVPPDYIPDAFPAWAVTKSPDGLMRNKLGKAVRKIKPGSLIAITADHRVAV